LNFWLQETNRVKTIQNQKKSFNFERIHAIIKPNVDKLFSTTKTKFEIRRTEAFREKRRVQNTVRSSRWISPWCVLCSNTRYRIYMYGDEDLFYTKQFLDIIFKSLYNRKTNLYLISENTIGLSLWWRMGLIHRKFRQNKAHTPILINILAC
jgi:hypothetical protein